MKLVPEQNSLFAFGAWMSCLACTVPSLQTFLPDFGQSSRLVELIYMAISIDTAYLFPSRQRNIQIKRKNSKHPRHLAFADGLASSWQSGSSRNSTSLPVRRKEVADSQLNALAQSARAQILRTSSATGEGVRELFQGIAEDLAPSITQACLEEDRPTEQVQLHLPTPAAAIPEIDVQDQSNALASRSKSNSPKKSCCF